LFSEDYERSSELIESQRHCGYTITIGNLMVLFFGR
jgi:hypothetical protein